MEPEQRTATVDVADMRAEGRTLRGFAALYRVESRDLGGFTERIEPGAFADVLAGEPDVYLTFNHSPDKVLARTSSGTLRLADEERGLAFEADLGDGPTAQDVREMVRRGDVSGASFRFKVAPDGEQWEGERRTLTKIASLIDLSLATTPAYEGPRVELRSAPDPQPEEANVPEKKKGAGLQVEDRVETAETEPSVEERVLEALRSVRKGKTRSLSTSSASEVTPPQLSTFLFDRLRPRSVALTSGIRVVPTDRVSIQWPKLVTDVDPGWVAEGEVIPAGDPGFDTLEATPKKLAHRVEFTNEVADDSDPNIIEVLNGHLTRMLALKLDLAIFEGNPSGDPDSIRGLKYVSGIQEVSMGANGDVLDDLDPIADAITKLEQANVPPPYVVVLNPRTFGTVRKLKEQTGSIRPVLADPPSLDAPLQVYGSRVLGTSQLSIAETAGTSSDTSSAYVYAPGEVVLVRRQDAAVEMDRSRLFDRDMSEIRARLRCDLIVPNPVAVVRIKGIRP